MKKILSIGFLAILLTALLMAGCAKKSILAPELGDITAPTVSSMLPANAATGVAINGNITATFSEAMTASTITASSFTVKQGTNSVAGAVTYVGTVATFNPTVDLAGLTLYTATITTAAKDVAGNALAVNKVWTFTTGTIPDVTAPTISSTFPVDVATGVLVTADITANFSEGMNAGTINSSNFTLFQGATPIAGVVSYAAGVATFNPTSDLAANLSYTATITTGAKDLAGNALAGSYIWSFTTVGPIGPAAVNLGTAGNFVMLAKSGISSVPTSAITGNIGVSPAAASFITGLPLTLVGSYATTPEVVGNVYAADYDPPTPDNMTTAIADMQTAYVDAAGRALPDFVDLYAGDISGQTLVPGLYKYNTGVLINTDVTLNGGPNDVWIFQISGGITMAAGVQMLLSGGAKAKNIFWQAFGDVTVNSGAHVEGVILSSTAITLMTGASVNGRLLAQTTVDIDQSTVTEPAP